MKHCGYTVYLAINSNELTGSFNALLEPMGYVVAHYSKAYKKKPEKNL